jgi:hypothetical protein
VVGELLPGDVRGRPRAAGSGVQIGGQLSQPRIRAIGERRLATLQPAERVLDPPFLGQRVGGTPELVRRGQVMADHLDQRVHTAQGGQRLLQVGRPEPIPVVPPVLPRLVDNLIDDLTYLVRSNMGPAVFRCMPRRSFLITRLVPIGAEWLISGATSVFPASQRAHICRIAADFALRQPALMFRNPDKLARGWELQRAERDRFVRFFGTDLIVLPGDQLADQMRQYQEFSRKELLATLPAPDRGRRADTPAPGFNLEPELAESDTVGVIYDEVEGLNFYAEFGLVEAVFADPALLRRRLYKQRLLDYLDDDSVSPLPFRRLANRDPDRASVPFQKLLRRPGFDWRTDGENLLREHKAEFYDRPPRPSITPISERLARYVTRPGDEPRRPRQP